MPFGISPTTILDAPASLIASFAASTVDLSRGLSVLSTNFWSFFISVSSCLFFSLILLITTLYVSTASLCGLKYPKYAPHPPAIKDAGASKIVVGEMPKGTEDILNKAKELSVPIDYSDKITALSDAYTNFRLDLGLLLLLLHQQYHQLSEAFVLQILLLDLLLVCIAFCCFLNQSKVYTSGEYDDVLIDKGTDAGGAIEVYAKEEDAEKRKEYLATYDGTIFANGTHTVIGTVLVRTSNKLTASQQKELEQKVIKALTKLE